MSDRRLARPAGPGWPGGLVPVTSLASRDPDPGDSDPDWVIAGVSVPSGVLLVASRSMCSASMYRSAAVPCDEDNGDVPHWRAGLSVVMDDFTQVRAGDYRSGLVSLLELWNPEKHRGAPHP